MTEQKADEQAKPTGLALMRADFPSKQISKLPKESRAQIDERKKDRSAGVSCKTCGSWHHKNAVHLDYVGHAAITNRLLDADPMWSWEPVAFGENGLPALDQDHGLWIKLTVCGHTRYGYGDAPGKLGGDAIKEAIGDAIRNAAMRFGAALELWSKADLSDDDEPESGGGNDKQKTEQPTAKPAYSNEQFDANHPLWTKRIAAGKATHAEIIATVESKYALTDDQKKKINAIKSPAAAPAAEEAKQ